VVEVGPRDGLQNEATPVSLEAKRAFIAALAASGLQDIEIGSFVRPDRVPQMAGSDALAASLPAVPGVTYWALVPNLRGAERAVKAGLRALAVFTAVSETFSQRNANASVTESLASLAVVTAFAAREGLRTRAYVSTCFGCPYEGRVAPEKVAEVSKALLDQGIGEISVGDTIGVATPNRVEEVFARLLSLAPASTWAGHFHDTRGTALANVLAALDLGVATFDASAGGLGGCPYAPGAAGNLATEDLVYLLEGMGIHTGVDLARLVRAAPPLEPVLGHPLPGKVLKAFRKGSS
jgi:hydroxymethylglutaryl-CoA lyase